MAQYPLPTTAKNEVLADIVSVRMEPRDFRWSDILRDLDINYAVEGTVSRLVHEPTGYYFVFDVRGDRPWYEYSPARESLKASGAVENIRRLLMLARDGWLPCLQEEAEATDLWAELDRVIPLVQRFAYVSDDDNFTAAEHAKTSKALDEIKQLLIDRFQVDEQQMRSYNAQLAYLDSRITRLNKKDWLHTAVGVLFSIAMGLGGAGQARELFQKSLDVISNAIVGIDLLP